MNWTADLILIGIIVVFAIIGMKKGLIMSLFTIVSSIISMIGAFILYPVVSKVIQNLPFVASFNNQLVNKMQQIQSQKLGGEAVKVTANQLLDNLNVPQIIRPQIEKSLGGFSNSSDFGELSSKISNSITNIFVNVISIIVIFILISIIMLFIKGLLKNITKLPILHQLDVTGGLFFGIIEGILLIYLTIAFISLFGSNPSIQPIIQAVDKSIIGGLFFRSNFIISFIVGR